MNKQPEVTEATRKKIADAFWALAKDNDISKIRIRDICQLAGYHRSTFYAYYPDIYALVSAEEDRYLEEIKRINPPRMLREEPGEFLPTMLPFIQANADRLSIMLTRSGFRFPRKIQDTMYPFFLDQYGLTDSDDVKLVFSFLFGGIVNTLLEVHGQEGEDRYQKAIPVVMSIFLHGPMRVLSGAAEGLPCNIIQKNP